MITLPTASYQPAVTYNGVWINKVYIDAPSSTRPITGVINVSAWDSGSDAKSNPQLYRINDMTVTASVDYNLATAMNAIYAYVQEQVNNGTITF